MKSRSLTGVAWAASIGLALMCVSAVPTAFAAGARKAPHRDVHYPAIGHHVRTLPQQHRNLRIKRQRYSYHNGSFYRPQRNGTYVVVRAPIGARVRSLPPAHVGFGIGSRRYFYANFTYYLWDRNRTEYIVVEEPVGAESAMVAASETVSSDVFVYPKEGQDEDQRDRDRFECYTWAVEQTGFDPGAAEPELERAGDYRRAISACLEGRGYSVK